MTLKRFIWKSALRNKRRTGLTMLSIGFSLFLLLALLTFMDQLLHPVSNSDSALRLIVAPSTSIADMIPLAYMDKIRRMPHVKHISPLQWFGGIYKDPDYQFANFACDPKEMFTLYSDQKLAPAQREAFIASRTAAVVTTQLAGRFGWKVGDRVTLTGTIFPVDPELTIVGIFEDPLEQETLYFSYEYFEELMDSPGVIGAYVVKVDDLEAVAPLAQQIDAEFRNSAHETKTETEKAFLLGFVSMLGNIQTIIGSIAGVVVFTMLLVALSTMAMTVRERLREVGILKTMGFPRFTILFLIVGESLFISGVGTGLGLLFGESLRFADLNRITQGFIVRFSPLPSTYAVVIGVGVVIGLVSGFFPAWKAVNLSVTTAMRRLD